VERDSDKISIKAQKKAFETIGENIKGSFFYKDIETFKSYLHNLTENSQQKTRSVR
jgi:hypothetical protein